MQQARVELILLLLLQVAIQNTHGLRVESLRELKHDATSITFEWHVYDPSLVASSTGMPRGIYSGEEESQEVAAAAAAGSSINNGAAGASYEDPFKSTGSPAPTSAELVTYEWIGFKIKYFTDKLQYKPILLKNLNVRKFRLDTLKPNTEYKIQVSAYSSAELEGPASNLLIVRTLDAVPGEPQEFKVVRVTSTSVELEWKPPRRDDHSHSHNIKGYEIHYFKVNGPVQSSSSTGGGGGNQPHGNSASASAESKDDTQIFKRKTNDIKKLKYTLSDLEPNSVYKIQIFAYNMRGDGQRSPPLVVTTLDDGPNKPENIRSEIYNDVLQIRWQPPLKGGKDQTVSGYRIFFNNEKYDLDGRANHISLERPKWEYDRYYEFRIAAKSAVAPSVFGQEAFYRISTFTNQTKINIKIEKLTSTSVHLRWNSVQYQAASGLQPYYKLEYWLQSSPSNVNTHDRLNQTDMHLKSLKANSDYIIQIVALIPPNHVYISEPTLKHFRTPLFDLPAPVNIQLTRYESSDSTDQQQNQFDKCDIKWEMPDQSRVSSVLKGYRVYYRELDESVAHGVGYEEEEESSVEGETVSADDEDDYLYSDANLDWKVTEIDASSLTSNDYTLNGLRRDRDYAIKMAALDYAGNEGEDSQVSTALKSLTPPTPEHVDESTQSSIDQQQSSSSSDQVPGAPRGLEITDVTSTSVKFAWMPPKQDGSRQAKDYRLSYVDRPKQYRECNGSLVTYARGLTMSVKVPGRGDPDMKITWLVTGLAPYTDYSFNISTLLANDESGPTIQRRIRTRPDKPVKVEQPVVLEAYSDNTVLLKLGNASELNGPVSKYWLVIVPLGANSFRNRMSQRANERYDLNEAREKDIAALVRYSQYNTSVSNESAFIAAEFDAANWPAKFILGDGRNYFGGFLNRRLTANFDYKAYIVAFTKDLNVHSTVHSPSTTIQSHKQQVKSPSNIGSPNMLGLGDLFSSGGGLDSELFSYSPTSLVFDTKYGSDGNLPSAVPHAGGGGASAQALNGYFHVFWVAGAIAAFIFIFILVVGVSVNVMQTNKKKQTKLIGSSPSNTTHLVMTTAGNRISGGASSMGTSSTTTQPNKPSYLDTAVTLTKSGVVATNTMKKNSVAMNNNSNNNTMSQQQQLLAAMMSSASSSTTSSTAAGSPTNTALLSCSVNNTGGGGSHTSTNSNTMLLNSNGLLTAASPLKHPNTTSALTPTLVSESLYTSIEATQRLFLQGKSQQQHQQQYNPYDVNMITSSPAHNNSSSLNATLNNTLMRMNQLSATYQYNQHLSSQFLHYDPIEWRRLNFSSPGLLSNPPVPCEELAQHVERLRANNNARLSAEYESIEPGQQFTWQCSTTELNRAKNRYANVVAYDHSRVVLTKLPPHAFSNHSNGGDLMLPPPPPPPPGSSNPSTTTTHPTSPNSMSACSDYINANYMDGYRCRNAYIATQGPLPSTLGDFWRMIWEQQTHTIVMLTRLEERQRLKCDQYWPNKGTETYDNVMQVTLMDCQELATYTVRTFVIQPVNIYAHLQQQANTSSVQRREVKHFQYTAWPDHGVPEHPTSFLMFIRRVKLYNSQQIETNCTSSANNGSNNNSGNTPSSVVVGPIVVHCSAGVGRTGCFVCTDTMMDRLRLGAERSVDIYGHVTCLRAQRNYMVQTEDQYGFIYDSCLEVVQTTATAGGSSNLTDVPIRDLYQHLQQLLQISSDDPQQMLTEMELEYKRLSNAKAPQSKFQAANMPANKFKNRLVNILPYESTRVCLDGDPLTGTDYINANFVDGYRYKRAYIATQAPLAETCDDFWRMLWEHDTSLVVMLTKLREMGREKCAQYWPTERRSVRYQYFVVDPVAEYNMGAYVLREFKVTDARDGQSRTVRQFQFVDWPEQGVPKSAESILELIGQVHKTKEQFGQTGPICVHCSAGVGRTGVFITLSIVLERMRYEGMCDVFNTVKMLRQQRPAMVQTEDQYQFCYRAALEYLGSFENNYD